MRWKCSYYFRVVRSGHAKKTQGGKPETWKYKITIWSAKNEPTTNYLNIGVKCYSMSETVRKEAQKSEYDGLPPVGRKGNQNIKQEIRAIFKDLRKDEQEEWSGFKLISPAIAAHIQRTLICEMPDETIAMRGYMGLKIRMIANLQKRGESTDAIRKLVRKTSDVDFLSGESVLRVGKLNENPAVSRPNFISSQSLLKLKYGGVQVQIRNRKHFTSYMLPTGFVTERATEVSLGPLGNGIAPRVIATEDMVLGKLSISDFEDGKGSIPPVHVLDLLTLAYSEKRTAQDFVMGMKEGFQERAKISGRVGSAEELWVGVFKASRRLMGWEPAVPAEIIKQVADDDSLPAEVRQGAANSMSQMQTRA